MSVFSALVVEDEIALRLIYERVLTAFHYDVDYVGDGETAQYYLESLTDAPDLIVLDMLLPDDGAEALFDYLQAHRLDYEATHIILTSSVPDFATYAEQLPRTYFARKPLLPRQFTSLMHKIQDARGRV